jgi:hypothetical protein
MAFRKIGKRSIHKRKHIRKGGVSYIQEEAIETANNTIHNILLEFVENTRQVTMMVPTVNRIANILSSEELRQNSMTMFENFLRSPLSNAYIELYRIDPISGNQLFTADTRNVESVSRFLAWTLLTMIRMPHPIGGNTAIFQNFGINMNDVAQGGTHLKKHNTTRRRNRRV